MTPGARNRRLSLLDCLVLLGATAVGFAMTKDHTTLLWVVRMESVDYGDRGINDPPGRMTSFKAAFGPPVATLARLPNRADQFAFCVQYLIFWASPCLAAWTVALLALSLIDPGVPMREILRRPGTISGLAWIAGFVAVGLSSPGTLIVRSPRFRRGLVLARLVVSDLVRPSSLSRFRRGDSLDHALAEWRLQDGSRVAGSVGKDVRNVLDGSGVLQLTLAVASTGLGLEAARGLASGGTPSWSGLLRTPRR